MPERTYYPIYLAMDGQACVVVGGGRVAERKVQSLLESGARVLVVCPNITAGLEAMAREGRIQYMAQSFAPSCLAGAFLAIAATNDRRVNARVSAEARQLGILVNVVDTPELSDFIVPAVVRRGPLVVSISTGGASPFMAGYLRRELEERFGPEYAGAMQELSELRRRLKDEIPDPADRCAVLNSLMENQVENLILEGRMQEVEELVQRCISSQLG